MAADIRSIKRVKRRLKSSQNPLFERWLKEWRDEAASKGSDSQYCFSRALKSLQKFPIRLSSGKECMMLENFGAKLCQKLDERLEAYKASHPEEMKLHQIYDKEEITSFEEITKVSKKRKSNGDSPIKRKKTDEDLDDNNKIKSSKYIPAYRSGAYAILMAMHEKARENNYKGYLTKAEIESEAQEYCDSSFKKPPPGSYYTAWSSMAVLIRKKLVYKEGKPFRFSLTKEGAELAVKLEQIGDGLNTVNNFNSPRKDAQNNFDSPRKDAQNNFDSPRKDAQNNFDSPRKDPLNCFNSPRKDPLNCFNSPRKDPLNCFNSPRKDPLNCFNSPRKDAVEITREKSLSLISVKRNEVKRSPLKKSGSKLSQEYESEPVSEADETIFMLPGTFEILLLVDTQERDEKFQQADGMTMRQLKSRKVNFEIRHLKVGDFIWIARDVNNGHELVLPYIVERKRYDDLASSIKDGRFHEQKFRLKQSGIENLIYLVEKYGTENQRLGLPLPTLHQAMANTQVLDGFTVRVTHNHDHSMRYLDCLTTQLTNLFRTKTLISCRKSNLSPANLSDDLISLMSFNDFNKGSEKNKKPTVRNMLVKHLVQLNGVSLEKAQAIVQLFPTPKALMEGLKRASGEKAIAEVTFGGLNRSIGPVTAKQIHMLYTYLDLR